MFWPICSPAWPIHWTLWRVNRNEAETLEWRPVNRPADLLTFIKWNCATPSHNPKDFCLPRQVNFMFTNLWSFPTIFRSSVFVRQNSRAEGFNPSVGEADKWGIQAWSWFLSIFANGRKVRRAQTRNSTSTGMEFREQFGCKKGRSGLRVV